MISETTAWFLALSESLRFFFPCRVLRSEKFTCFTCCALWKDLNVDIMPL